MTASRKTKKPIWINDLEDGTVVQATVAKTGDKTILLVVFDLVAPGSSSKELRPITAPGQPGSVPIYDSASAGLFPGAAVSARMVRRIDDLALHAVLGRLDARDREDLRNKVRERAANGVHVRLPSGPPLPKARAPRKPRKVTAPAVQLETAAASS